jgi:3-hydroxybutyryl-CoA dehydrogenase
MKDLSDYSKELQFLEAKLKFLNFMISKKRTNDEIISCLGEFENWISQRLQRIEIIRLSSDHIKQTEIDIKELKEKITEADKAAALSKIQGSTQYEDLMSADLVIEAATENQDLKVKILKQLDALLAPDVIIASNTSSISITQLAAVTTRADRFIGMHFFNPVPMMALVEIIRGLQTSDETHDAVHALATALGKTPITVKNAPGFVVNRILVPMINEALFVLSEGLATPDDIDAGMKLGCNQPIGPLALADMIGLDVCLAVMEVYLKEFGDSKYRPCPLLKELVAAGRLGRKTGHGVYQY